MENNFLILPSSKNIEKEEEENISFSWHFTPEGFARMLFYIQLWGKNMCEEEGFPLLKESNKLLK